MFEVLLECVLPLVISSLINTIQGIVAGSAAEDGSGIIYKIQTLLTSWAGGDSLNAIIIHGVILITIHCHTPSVPAASVQ